MESSTKKEVKELKGVLGDLDHRGKKCTLCRVVLIFSGLVFIVVLIFVSSVQYQTRKQMEVDARTNKPLPPEKAGELSQEEWNQHLINLGGIIHPELRNPSTSPIQLPPPPTKKT